MACVNVTGMDGGDQEGEQRQHIHRSACHHLLCWIPPVTEDFDQPPPQCSTKLTKQPSRMCRGTGSQTSTMNGGLQYASPSTCASSECSLRAAAMNEPSSCSFDLRDDGPLGLSGWPRTACCSDALQLKAPLLPATSSLLPLAARPDSRLPRQEK